MDEANGKKRIIPVPEKPRQKSWGRVLATGFILYVIGLIILATTGNPNLFPTVIMLGNFLIPITFVAFFFDHRHLSRVNLSSTMSAFVYGGILGLFAASLLEPLFISEVTAVTFLLIGFIEEFAKILGVMVIARHHRHNSEMDGLLIGAAVGMGFASLESNGYTFVAFLQSGGSVSAMMWVTLLRGVLSPVGHGTWTAILASVMFRESRVGKFVLNGKVIGVYILVSVLHGLWDGFPEAIMVTLGSGLAVLIGNVSIGALGLYILWRRWKEAVRLQLLSMAPVPVRSAAEALPGSGASGNEEENVHPVP